MLSHEAIIDAAWDVSIKPLLLQRFPDSTKVQLREAHGYAYGGAIIQDMGYYPHGSRFFSDLTHYVRSGDFVLALIRDSKDLNGYAFALGAMAHYSADNAGHSIRSTTKKTLWLTSRPNSDLMCWKLPNSTTLRTATTISLASRWPSRCSTRLSKKHTAWT